MTDDKVGVSMPVDATSTTQDSNIVKLYEDGNKLLIEDLTDMVDEIAGIVAVVEFKNSGTSVVVSNRSPKDMAFSALALQDAFSQAIHEDTESYR